MNRQRRDEIVFLLVIAFAVAVVLVLRFVRPIGG